MVEQSKTTYVRGDCGVYHGLYGAVTPTRPRWILLSSVLGVVDDKVGVREEKGVFLVLTAE